MAAHDGNLASIGSVSNGDIQYDLIPVEGHVAPDTIMHGGDIEYDLISVEGKIVFSTGGASGPVFRMRAFDSSLDRTVYWYSLVIDSDGTDYPGAGPLTDIVISVVVCS